MKLPKTDEEWLFYFWLPLISWLPVIPYILIIIIFLYWLFSHLKWV